MSNGVADSQSSGQIIDSLRGLDTSTTKELTGDVFGMPHMNGTMAKSTISVAVDPVALITTECITVTSAMRKNPRWAHSSVSAILGGSPTNPSLQSSRPSTPGDELGTRKGLKSRPGLADGEEGGLANRWGLRGKKGKSMQDNPLMAGFGRLRHELMGCKGMDYLLPFGCSKILTGARHTQIRYAFLVTPIPTSHTSFCDLRPHYIPRPCCHHEVLLIQPHKPRLPKTFTRYAVIICCYHTLPI